MGEKAKYTHKKLPSTHIGLHADRGCTNCFFGILFIILWGLMAYVAVVAIQLGDLERLLYGVDYLGNTCSKTIDPCEGAAPGCTANINWTQSQFLWYPITFDTSKKTFLITEALKLGVCVDRCPTAWDRVYTYGRLNGSTPGGVPSYYRALYTSKPLYHRCVPDFLTFMCPTSSRVNFNISDCIDKMNSSKVEFDKVAGITSAVDGGFDELKSHWWVILTCAGIGIVICFLWLFILRRLVKPMVVITMVLVFILLAGLGGLLFWRYTYFKEHEPQSETKTYYLVGAIAAWVVAFLYLCLVAFAGKDIMVACDIIEEAAKVPIKIPTMMLVPPVLLIALIPFLLFALFVAANIYTAAKTITHELPTPNTNYNSPGTSSTELIQFKEYKFENWRIYAQLFNLFMFLWTMGFIHAIGFMVISFCGVFWYWSKPGDDKQPEAGVCRATGLCFKNHLGTLALGSLIVAIIQILRVMLGMVEHRMKKLSEHATMIRFIVACAQCCLACFERIIKFINKNAYIVTAMTGESFLPAARHALSLLMGNALSVGAVTVIGEYVMIFGKLLITSATCASAYGILRSLDTSDSPNTGWLVIIAVGVITYFIACVFLNVFGVCIDTVLLSYCYDLDENNGMDKPYFFPSDLAKHVDRASERMEAQRAADKDYERSLQTREVMRPLRDD